MAIRVIKTKNGKAICENEITGEMIKSLGEFGTLELV